MASCGKGVGVQGGVKNSCVGYDDTPITVLGNTQFGKKTSPLGVNFDGVAVF